MDFRLTVSTIVLLASVPAAPALAISVTPQDIVLFDFELNSPPVAGPYDRVGFELISDSELQLTAFDAWDVTLADETGFPGPFGTGRASIDVGGQATADDPVTLFSFRFTMGVFEPFSATSGQLQFSNSFGDYGLGEVRIFFQNVGTDPDARVYTDITRVVVIPEPGTASLVLLGFCGMSRLRRRARISGRVDRLEQPA